MIKTRNHSAHEINYHVVFCPKRRKNVLVDGIAHDCRAIIAEVCAEVKTNIVALEIMPDHVHLFVSSHPKISPHIFVKKIKGRLAHVLREKYPQLKRTGCMWSSSYYIGTVGHVSESVVKMYIEGQKGK